MNLFLLGAIAAASFAVGLFFLAYWRTSRDRFFLFLAASFWIEAANRAAMAMTESWSEDVPFHYFVRFVAYGLILIAIWEKNRPPP